jgi:hypothetical protein
MNEENKSIKEECLEYSLDEIQPILNLFKKAILISGRRRRVSGRETCHSRNEGNLLDQQHTSDDNYTCSKHMGPEQQIRV